MNTEKYNGWTNRETWLVNLYFDNMFEMNVTDWIANDEHYENNPPSRQEIAEYLKDCFEAYIEPVEDAIDDMPMGGFIKDFIDFGKIDWYDLAENYVEEEE